MQRFAFVWLRTLWMNAETVIVVVDLFSSFAHPLHLRSDPNLEFSALLQFSLTNSGRGTGRVEFEGVAQRVNGDDGHAPRKWPLVTDQIPAQPCSADTL